jgi:hypothetical protein
MNYEGMQEDIVEVFTEAQASARHVVPLRKGDGFQFLRSKKLAGLDPRSKPFVDQYGSRYDNQNDAVRRTGCNNGLIYRVLVGERKSTKGYQFRYLHA